MKSFEYASPATVAEAVGLLADRWDQTSLLAGGTDLVTSLKQGILAPQRVISLKGVEALRGIAVSGDQVEIGAMTRLAEISQHPTVRQEFPAVAHAIQSIGSPQIIAMGTLGGNLCQRPRCWYYRQGFGLLGQKDGESLIPEGDNRLHAIFGNQGPAYFVSPSTLAPALIALGATLRIAGPGDRQRTVPVAEFYRVPARADQREYALEPDQIVTGVVVPRAGLANATYKVRQRAGLDWPLVTASVAFQSGAAARHAAVVLGHVAPKPWPVPHAAAVLEGKPVDEALADQAGKAATRGAAPLSQNQYKVPLVKAAVKRAVLTAAGLPVPAP